jgi:tetratricopeptide (TPR) repeat protein
MTSAQMAGDADLAIETADKLARLIDDDIARQVPWVQAIKAAPFFAHAQFSDADVVLGLAEPDPDFTFVQAMRHYARAKVYAQAGDFPAARRERSELVAIGRANDFRDLVDGGLPAPDILDIANNVLIGRIAQGEGNPMAAVEAFRAAVAVQSQLPYMEPPYWYYPVRQSLGAALLQAGKVDEAEQVLRTALVESPNNGWALFALEQALLARGETKAASVVAEAFENAWIGDPDGRVLSLTRI